MFGNTQGSDVSQSRRGPARAMLAGGFTTAVVAYSDALNELVSLREKLRK